MFALSLFNKNRHLKKNSKRKKKFYLKNVLKKKKENEAILDHNYIRINLNAINLLSKNTYIMSLPPEYETKFNINTTKTAT